MGRVPRRLGAKDRVTFAALPRYLSLLAVIGRLPQDGVKGGDITELVCDEESADNWALRRTSLYILRIPKI